MLIIGSRAAAQYISLNRNPVDWDIIANRYEWDEYVSNQDIGEIYEYSNKKFKGIINGRKVEVNFTTNFPELQRIYNLGYSISDKECEQFPAMYAPFSLLVALKRIQLRYNIHWEKTLNDFLHFNTKESNYNAYMYVVEKYFLAKFGEPNNINLNVSSEEFLENTNANCLIDHDELHRLIAAPFPPVYTELQVSSDTALLCKSKWNQLPLNKKHRLCCEEITVIALERGIIPHGMGIENALIKAHKHTILKLSKGWFREHCIEFYDEIQCKLEHYTERIEEIKNDVS